MKAVRCNAWGLPETLVVEDLPSPVPKVGEVLLDIKAASVNFPDVLMIQKKYQVQPELPFTPGSEVAGTVRALGEGVTNVKVGDRVIAFVGLGEALFEQVAAGYKAQSALHDTLSPEDAAHSIVALLAMPKLTGQLLTVDAGRRVGAAPPFSLPKPAAT